MENIFKRQSELIKSIEKICVNFSKDGPSRKTREYIEKRLLALDSLWGEFDSNNEILIADEDQAHEYFTKNIYMSMKRFFETERKKIAEYPVPAASLPDAEDSDREKNEFYVPISSTDPLDNSRVIDDLLNQQRTNFRAFLRIVDRTLLDSLEEKWEIEDQLKELQRRWRAIDELHLRIDNYLQGRDQGYENEFLTHERKFLNIKKQLNQKINSASCLQQSTPKIEIPVFTGKFTQWPTFFDLFKETIHDNKCLNKAQKLQHLKGKLKGEAERLIQHLSISSHNYDTAWDILTHRYNNVQALFTHYIETFLSQPNVSKQSSYELKRLHDTTMETIHAIHNLEVDTSTWDPLLVHLITKKLDSETYKDYKEARRSPRELPSFDELMSFIESKFVALEPINKREKESFENKFTPSPQISRVPHFKPGYQNRSRPGKTYQAAPTFTKRCPHCKLEHDLWQCKRFLNLPSDNKINILTKQQICRNCLYKHNDKPCVSTHRCKYCNDEHNSLIHEDMMRAQNIQPSSSQLGSSTLRSPSPPALTMQTPITSNNAAKAPSNKQLNVNYVAGDDEEILLTTLLLKIKSNDGTYVILRGLLDQGSQISLVSEHAAQLLGIQRQRHNACVSGIGASSKSSRGIVTLECESIYGDYNFTTQALVISRLINQLPNATFKKTSWPHLQNINLADPEYNVSKPIDLLLDASVYSDIIMSGLIKGSHQAPIAQQTKLGWILSGNVKTFQCNVVVNDIGDLSRFWEIEDISQSSQTLTEAEQLCETFYEQTTRRLDCGRYEVALPMKQGFEQSLGSSKLKAISQFRHLEKRMTHNPPLSSAYHNFMNEYETLRHMRPVDHVTARSTCCLPHHGVSKLDSMANKLRIVYNAPSKTSPVQSLNNLMKCGHNLQQDFQALILKWRTHRYVVTADIEKMFRQFLVRECDQPLQSIIWRASPEDPLIPHWLTSFESQDITSMKFETPTIESKKRHVNAILHQNQNNNFIYQLLQDCSSSTRVMHIVGWVSRFLSQLRKRQGGATKNAIITNTNVLSSTEINCEKCCKTKAVQTFEFKHDIYQLRKNGHVNSNIKLSCPNPFLSDQRLHVGGRLNNNKITYAVKHPTLLSLKHRLTVLIIHQSHITTNYGGSKLTLSHIRLNYWILSGKGTVKKLIRLCIQCRRYSQETRHQIMADLLSPRVTPARPYTSTEVIVVKSHNSLMKRPTNKLILIPACDDAQPDDSHPSGKSQDGTSNIKTGKTSSGLHFGSVALLLYMTMISPSLQQTTLPYNNSLIKNQQSLYFDQITELQHIRDEWKLIIYYNMSTYWDGVSSIKHKYLNHIKTMCQGQYAQYESIILQLEHEMQEIKHYNSLLVSQTAKRQKRGLINGMGYIANSLFGILDERFAEKYREDIEKITSNENHHQNLIKNQTLIIESQYNIIRRNEQIMNTQLTSINQHLANISIKISNMRSDAENNAYITTSIFAISIIISNLRHIQESIINTLTDINHGRIDVHFLPPEQLEKQITIIRGQLHGDLTLPIDEYNVRQLYKLIKARARIHKDYLIIEARILLVSNEIYELDQIITIPLQRGDKVQYTIPTHPYIAFNIKRDSAFLLSKSDVQSCLHMQNKVICSIDNPIYELTSKQSICDVKLLHTEKPTPSPCSVQLSACDANKWIKLHRQNSWLYSCCKQCNIRIYCAAGMDMKTLHGNGILNLGQGCTVKGETFTIFSHRNYFSHAEGQPDEITVPETSLLNTIINTSVPYQPYDSVPLQETNSQTWEKMKAQIEQLKLGSSQQINVHDVHHYVLQYTLLAGLAAVIVVIMFLWRKRRLALAPHGSPPAPRALAEPAPPRAAPRLSLQYDDTVAPKFDP